MPTIRGLRRRGYTPASLRDFAQRVGVAKRENIIDVSLLEFCVREDLNKHALRRFAVLDPLKVVITNYPEDQVEWLETENNPEDETPETGPCLFPGNCTSSVMISWKIRRRNISVCRPAAWCV